MRTVGLRPKTYLPLSEGWSRATIRGMKALIVCNWKMHPTSYKEAKLLLAATKKSLQGKRGVSVVIAPPSLYLQPFTATSKSAHVSFGAQNMHAEAQGAHTGEISAPQLKDLKVQYVIIGHAERRSQGETNEDVRAKVHAAIAANLTPILCIGERTRNASGDYFTEVREQLYHGLKDVSIPKLSKVVIAYEPIWAIGASEAMTPQDMHEMSIYIRKSLVEKYGEGHAVTILYGGSIDAENAPAMLKEGDVKGLLVGRASADRDKVTALIGAIARA